MKISSIISAIVLISSFTFSCSQLEPTFDAGHDPAPKTSNWTLVESLSDEFEDNELDESKWKNADPKGWIGRAPGIFKKNTVSLEGGKLLVTNYKLKEKEVVQGQTFTHAGGHLESQVTANVGQYFECRMKSNKTFMSSTFWLINDWNSFEGCDNRVTELDIQESVGQITTEEKWAQDFNTKMNSNTHSRHVTCDDSVGIVGGKAMLSGKVYDDFHVYGAWWKIPTEIQFYLDGQLVNTVEPVADFNLPMYIKLVTETYDWNPTPVDGGMTGTKQERTTYYDWVRVWELNN